MKNLDHDTQNTPCFSILPFIRMHPDAFGHLALSLDQFPACGTQNIPGNIFSTRAFLTEYLKENVDYKVTFD